MSKPIKDIAATIDVPQDLIKELLTESEWRMVKQRLLVIKLLSEGLSIRAIAKQIEVGTDTVVRISKKLKSSPLLRQIYKKVETSSNSKWVFGTGGKRTT